MKEQNQHGSQHRHVKQQQAVGTQEKGDRHCLTLDTLN